MSALNVTLLGLVAGLTVVLGLPVGRLRRSSLALTSALNALAIGILLFLVWDILSAAWEPAESALADHRFGSAVTHIGLLAAGIAVGLVGLTRFDRVAAARRTRTTPTTGSLVVAPAPAPGGLDAGTATQLSWTIAVGIGLHNLAEGLAIGAGAAAGQLSLALMLVIGFGLHNATEGFGVVAPLAAAGVRPSWGRLLTLGAVAGGPTFVGTLLGRAVTDDRLTTAVLGLATGSVLYVVVELLAVARRLAPRQLTAACLVAGLLLGFVTDGILVAAGA